MSGRHSYWNDYWDVDNTHKTNSSDMSWVHVVVVDGLRSRGPKRLKAHFDMIILSLCLKYPTIPLSRSYPNKGSQ